jgi:Putative tail fiber protein gp53-like, C-terminal
MHRIDGPGNVNGKFTEGDPGAGQKATKVTADWLNDLQENAAYIIEQAGIVLEKNNAEQLSDAIVALVAGAVGDGSGAVPVGRQISVAGDLLTGGGTLAADRTITLLKAVAADVSAGTADDKAITPLALATAAAAGLTTNGYWQAPGGLIVQWGQLRGNYVEGSVAVSFPIAFSAAPFAIIPAALNQTGNNANDIHVQNVSRSASGATFYFNYDGQGNNQIQGLDYLAIGN